MLSFQLKFEHLFQYFKFYICGENEKVITVAEDGKSVTSPKQKGSSQGPKAVYLESNRKSEISGIQSRIMSYRIPTRVAHLCWWVPNGIQTLSAKITLPTCQFTKSPLQIFTAPQMLQQTPSPSSSSSSSSSSSWELFREPPAERRVTSSAPSSHCHVSHSSSLSTR